MNKIDVFLGRVADQFPADRVTYQKGIATFHPESVEEGAGIIKLANKTGQKLFITGFGNCIDPAGDWFEDKVAIRTDRLNRLHEIAREDFFVRVGAGYPLRELNGHLAEAGLFFPHASLPYVGSAGGAVSVNLDAEVARHAWPIKKYLIQAEIVTPQGEIINPGSVCFKSVSGYDVVKIFAPSWGILGLIVSVTFRVLPVVAAEEYLSMKMKEVDRAGFLAGFDDNNQNADAIYSRRIKNKFDPGNVLPITQI